MVREGGVRGRGRKKVTKCEEPKDERTFLF